MQLPKHGANPNQFVSALGMEMKEDSIDFSVNTNPLGFPTILKDTWEQYIENIDQYPDPNSEKLTKAIADHANVDSTQVLVGNGAAEIIFLIANHFRNKNVLIIEPTFTEYRDACEAFDCNVQSFTLNADDWTFNIGQLINQLENIDLLFLCHPNNPTGVTYERQKLELLFKQALSNNVTVVIDEAFYDFSTSNITVSNMLPSYENLLISRSLTKMYGIAGLRLGYLLANQEWIKNLKKLQQPWSINGLAQQAGLVCLDDKEHVKKTAKYIKNERTRLQFELEKIGYEVSNSQVNYYLLKEKGKNEDLQPLIQFLINHCIIPRHTYNFPVLNGRYIRLAVKTHEENNRLLSILKEWKLRC
ncbi:threonine-phosphate decarboxylase CobD [Bacillus sp. FJAT-45350]|uniref:threonine-phosphate decarboxylase CobD n=1 Tax=Bacillus sp. FJAT-45350 TaxID=2011014 RepID=UPI000BB806AA|nr:threonine-phosphate decarboxylase CobD [Bacillus sp. FJAT-45350]